MQGYSPKLPLAYDKGEDGAFSLNKTIIESIRQNLKMLLLTIPGERPMDSSFGVGLERYIFELDNSNLRESVRGKIQQQINKYMNFIQINEINISPPQSNDQQIMFILIRYSVPSINIKDELNIQL